MSCACVSLLCFFSYFVISVPLGAPDAWLDFGPRDGTMPGVGAAPAGMQGHTVRDDFQSDFDCHVRRWAAEPGYSAAW